ncbi:MAG: zinc-dependent peptidase [Ferruginibacter sp.]
MPQDTIWLNDRGTEYILQSSIDSGLSTATHRTGDYKPTSDETFKQKSDRYSSNALPFTLMILAALWLLVKRFNPNDNSYTEIGSGSNNNDYDNDEQYKTAADESSTETSDPCLCYEGNQLNFSNAAMALMLNKRSVYFTKLNPFEKEKFIKRLQLFISKKTFYIHDNSGFKEMPVLISASAIQLSFGLENFLLPDFHYIHIYPDAFVRVDQTIKFLEGNVSGDCINISWKYFLEGFDIPDDGQNVGLHEMAHAYYFQNLQCSECEDRKFKNEYSVFELNGDKVFKKEAEPGNDLYSDYAMTNFQEFWAESVEIFFEKPMRLRSDYPELYETIRDLLNQDPARKQL